MIHYKREKRAIVRSGPSFMAMMIALTAVTLSAQTAEEGGARSLADVAIEEQISDPALEASAEASDPESGVDDSSIESALNAGTPLEATSEARIEDAIDLEDLSYEDVIPEDMLPQTDVIDIEPTPLQSGSLIDDEAKTVEVSRLVLSLLEDNALALDEPFNQGLLESYRARKGQLVFVTNADLMLAVKKVREGVAGNGLPPVRYDFYLAPLEEKFANEPIALLALEELKNAMFVHKYSRDMERGIVDFASMGPEFDLDPAARDYAQYLPDLQAAPDTYFQDLEPQDPAWKVFKAELVRLRDLVKDDALASLALVPTDKTLRLGEKGPAVEILRARLEALGYDTENVAESSESETVTNNDEADAIAIAIASELGAEPTTETATNTEDATPVDLSRFDEGLRAAVIAFQTDRGLAADGIAGAQTLSGINSGGPTGQMRSLLIAMERLKWGPNDTKGRQLFVNIANYVAEIRDDNRKTFETIVVVGKNDPKYRTPEFHDEFEYVVINPRWNVPRSITVDEFLPRLQAGRGLGSTYELLNGSGKVVNPASINFSKYTAKTFPYRIVQKPGPRNALGKVKFIFPNRHNIYLHDTPETSLFAQPARAYSHGCVRVRDPIDLAATLLAPSYSDPRAEFEKIRATEKERYVPVKEKFPVFLTYFTAIIDEVGQVRYINDVYGRDPIVAKALNAQGLQL